jgi:hypothetical protein
MEEKITAVYLLVFNSELKPEDAGSYERALEKQKQKCLEFMRKKGIEESKAVFYKSRRELFTDIERDRIARLITLDAGRLSVDPGELEGALHELHMRRVELLTVTGEPPGVQL